MKTLATGRGRCGGSAWLAGAAARGALCALAVSVGIGGATARAVTIDWVTVGDPGNTADTTGSPNPAGAVASSFQIMKYEWTNSLYVQYLNAVDPQGTNPNSIYNASGGDQYGVGFSSGNPSGSKYTVISNMGNKPATTMSWYNAARVANWLHNGAQTYATTDSSASAPQNTGAYTLGTATSGAVPAVNPGANFFLPTQDQWYKAAYYKGSGTNAGYWDYPTRNDTSPTPVTAGATGDGSAGSTGNFANYGFGASWNSGNVYVTTVGSNGGPSAYGTFDMGGNVWEWTDTMFSTGPNQIIRGGGWRYGGVDRLSANYFENFDPSVTNNFIGFRLASPASSPSGVPEIDPAGMGSVLALVTGAFGLLERRRAKAKAA